ncbi:hypothetical protein GXW83_08680 [Streptacidiphilus sp. PB12-B1b]|uniref:hypothetical protein n=1 Tax=Streptacidiphilus sp. PB12-B1b TaxID=2705012 RepID=UPI0015F8A876|nr:hypothetical protein [Streptacidiphilus sp. PB12-B1b]QMU75804.1 hypothetical protein GXW83_08680 [Streptacidiphilus sp. PB12-B1b]
MRPALLSLALAVTALVWGTGADPAVHHRGRSPAAAAPTTAQPLPAVLAGRPVVFREEFDTLRLGPVWGWQTAAYARCTSNPGQHKLDLLTRSALSVAQGVLTITARPGPRGQWTTGLLSTGDTCSSGGDGVRERTGDVVLAHVRLPSLPTPGAWPAIWSWRSGGREVDLFEWHADRPHTLELVNHVRTAYTYWDSPQVAAGAWLYVAVQLGATDTTWYVGTSLAELRTAWSDHRGVGTGFSAYPVVSLSVDDGSNHAVPADGTPITFEVGSFAVYGPAAGR